MDILAEIRQKLLSGKKPVDLVKEGYAKSSVYYVAKKVQNVQTGIAELPADDELAELRRRKEIIKLEKEIAELEAIKEKLPERVAALEPSLEGLLGQISFLERQLNLALDAVEDIFFQLNGIAMSVYIDDYGALVSRKRTEQDKDLAEKEAGEVIVKYRLEKGESVSSPN